MLRSHYAISYGNGGVESDGHRNFFPSNVTFNITNINTADQINSENLTDLSHPSNSIECAICISVLQHVFDVNRAIAEIIRVLKPGGKCLITNGYIFPICMDEDYYRLTPAFWMKRLENEPVNFQIIPLGNLYDSIDNLLMRPYSKYYGFKILIHKLLSIPFKLLRIMIKNGDSAPLGVAVIISKK